MALPFLDMNVDRNMLCMCSLTKSRDRLPKMCQRYGVGGYTQTIFASIIPAHM